MPDSLPRAPERVVVCDVDGDGAVDAAFSSAAGNAVIVAHKHPSLGGYVREQSFPVGTAPRSLCAGDLDGDGFLDLVTANAGSGDYTVLWNDRAGGFGATRTLPGQRVGAWAAMFDLDRDGDLDVVGIDGLDDHALFFRQTEVAPPNVLPSCAAALRLNALAGSAGYGGAPAQRVVGGRPLLAGVTGTRTQFWALFGGVGLQPGLPIVNGTFNLAPTALVSLAAGIFDDAGEARVAIATPSGLPPGLRLSVQDAVTTSVGAGGLLTNPETVETR